MRFEVEKKFSCKYHSFTIHRIVSQRRFFSVQFSDTLTNIKLSANEITEANNNKKKFNTNNSAPFIQLSQSGGDTNSALG